MQVLCDDPKSADLQVLCDDPQSADLQVLCDGLQRTQLIESDEDFEDEYMLLEMLGQGGWAAVYAVERQDGAGGRLAVKVMDKHALSRRTVDVQQIVGRMRDEVRVLSELPCETPAHTRRPP